MDVGSSLRSRNARMAETPPKKRGRPPGKGNPVVVRDTKPEDVSTAKMTAARWLRFVTQIAAGVKRGVAEVDIGLSSYTVSMHMATLPKAAEEYKAAQLEWVRRGMDPVVVDGVIELIADGKTLKKACAHFVIEPATFQRWVLYDPLIAERYKEARIIQAESMLDDMIDIADDGQNDTYDDTLRDGSVVTRTNFDVVQRSRLRLEQRRWHTGKMNPDRFGDKVKIDQNVNTTVNHVEQLDAARRRKEEAAKKRMAAAAAAAPPGGESHVTH